MQPQPINIDLNSLVVDPSIKKIYANNFVGAFSATDATIVVFQGSNPECIITSSWTGLKLLQQQVNDLVKNIEDTVDTKILEPVAINQKMLAKVK